MSQKKQLTNPLEVLAAASAFLFYDLCYWYNLLQSIFLLFHVITGSIILHCSLLVY